jgi:hypothetical protein
MGSRSSLVSIAMNGTLGEGSSKYSTLMLVSIPKDVIAKGKDFGGALE